MARLEPSTMSQVVPDTFAADTSRGTTAACTAHKAIAGQKHRFES